MQAAFRLSYVPPAGYGYPEDPPESETMGCPKARAEAAHAAASLAAIASANACASALPTSSGLVEPSAGFVLQLAPAPPAVKVGVPSPASLVRVLANRRLKMLKEAEAPPGEDPHEEVGASRGRGSPW